MFERILVPLGGAAVGESVLEPARRLAELLSAELVLLRVVAPHPATAYLPQEGGGPSPRELVEAERAALALAGAYLQAVADRLSAYVPVRAELRRGGVPEEIVRAVRDLGCGLIAAGTHGHGSLRRVVGGSLTDELVRRSPVPVLLCLAPRGRDSSVPHGAGREVAAGRAR